LTRQFRSLGKHTRSNMRLLKILPLLLIVVGAVILFERPAYAYADPGTGLLAIQAVGSALVASGWYLRRKIYALFNKGGAAVKETEAAPAAGKGDDSPNS
jgi:O-antigen/teichoic acid export membrane protein